MSTRQFPKEVPLFQDDRGRIRVIGSRVTLDTIVARFQQGDTPQDIQNGFPTLSLTQINAVIEWYLNNQAEADGYIQELEAEAEAFWKRYESKPENKAAREELLRRCEELRRQRAQLSEP